MVKTDNDSLTYLLSTAKLDATGHQSFATLSKFQFSLKYRPGAGDRDADALSRRPHIPSNNARNWVHLTPIGVHAMCQGVEHCHKGAAEAEAVGITPTGVPQYYCDLTQVRSQELPQLTKEDMRRDQWEDPLGSLVKKALIARDPQMLLKSSLDGAKVVHKEWKRMRLEDGISDLQETPQRRTRRCSTTVFPRKVQIGCINRLS